MAPSAGSGVSTPSAQVAVGGTAVVGSTNPNGVSVDVAVAVGSAVILGNGVSVMEGVAVGKMGVTVKVGVGAAVSVWILPVSIRFCVGMTGVATVAGSVNTQADAASNVTKAITNGLFFLFILPFAEKENLIAVYHNNQSNAAKCFGARIHAPYRGVQTFGLGRGHIDDQRGSLSSGNIVGNAIGISIGLHF